MNSPVRTPHGYARAGAPAPANAVDSAATTSVVASPGEAIIGDTTTASIAVELPPASKGGTVTVVNGAGANTMDVTPAPGTDVILAAGGPIVNPATTAVAAGISLTLVAVRLTSTTYGWTTQSGALAS